MAFSPVNVFFTAEFMGGDDLEEYHCPEIEWDWDDEGKSVQESDCDPWTEGTKIERRFSNDHDYRKAGTYNVKATFRRSGRTLAQATVRVTVRPASATTRSSSRTRRGRCHVERSRRRPC
jgi:hypothetical protein